LFGNPGKGVSYNPALNYMRAQSFIWNAPGLELDLDAGGNRQRFGSVNNRNVAGYFNPYLIGNISKQLPRDIQVNLEGSIGPAIGLGGASDQSGADPLRADPSVPWSLRWAADLGGQIQFGDTTYGVELLFNREQWPNIRNTQQPGLPCACSSAIRRGRRFCCCILTQCKAPRSSGPRLATSCVRR
jgi:hypothetical protein